MIVASLTSTFDHLAVIELSRPVIDPMRVCTADQSNAVKQRFTVAVCRMSDDGLRILKSQDKKTQARWTKSRAWGKEMKVVEMEVIGFGAGAAKSCSCRFLWQAPSRLPGEEVDWLWGVRPLQKWGRLVPNLQGTPACFKLELYLKDTSPSTGPSRHSGDDVAVQVSNLARARACLI